MFWPLNSSSEFSGVSEDSKFPFLGVWVSSSHLAQNGVTTMMAPLVIFWQKLLQEEEEGQALCFSWEEDGAPQWPPCVFLAKFVARGGKGEALMFLIFFLKVCCPRHYSALMSSAWHCFRLSFCTPFWPCTSLQETMQPGFECFSKRLKKHIFFPSMPLF